jgi:hypothetical protein
MLAPRIDSFGTPGIWFAASFAGMPRIYDVPLKPSLALIVVAFPFVCYAWYRTAREERRALFCVAYAVAGIGYLIGLAMFLEFSVFQWTVAAVFRLDIVGCSGVCCHRHYANRN